MHEILQFVDVGPKASVLVAVEERTRVNRAPSRYLGAPPALSRSASGNWAEIFVTVGVALARALL